MFEDTPIIACYSRQDAIDDGNLVPLSDLTDDAQILKIYRYPICLTSLVYGWIESDLRRNPHKDLNGILWDILWMSQKNIVRRLDESTVLFKLLLNDKTLTLKIQCHPSDDMTPCLTIMGERED